MKRARVGPVLLLSAITIAFYWKILLVHQYSLLLGYEGANQMFAWFTYWVGALRAGTLPIWDPFTFSGHAFAGEMQTGAFYPPYLLFLLGPFRGGLFSAQLYHYFFALTHIACACFMYVLARELGLSRFAGVISGVCFSLGGVLAQLNVWPHLLESGVWLPLVFFFLLRALKAANASRRLLYCALSGLGLATSILAGGLHFIVMEAFAVVSVAIFYAAQIDPPANAKTLRRYGRGSTVAAITIAFALCGGAVQLIPSVEYSRQAFRFLGNVMVPATDRIPYAWLGDSLWPFSILGMFFDAFAGGSASSGEYLNPYLGLFPAVLAVIALIQCRRSPWVRYFAGMAVAAFACSLGNISLLHGLLYALVPFFSMAREADRFMYLADFAVAILAGYGLDALLSGLATVSWAPFERIFRWAAVLAALALAWPLILGRGDPSVWVSLSLLLIIVSFGLFSWLRRSGDGHWARFLVLSLILFDLNAFDWVAANKIEAGAKGQDDMQRLLDTRGVVKFLRSRPGMFRVQVLANLAPNIGDAFRIETIMGNAVTLEKDYNRMKDHPDLLNARYRIEPASAKDPGAVYEDSQWKVYENPGAYPRAWLVHETIVEPDSDRLFGRLDTQPPDLHRVALVGAPLEASLSPAPGGGDETVTVRRPTNNTLELEARSQGPALMVVSETFYPGWRATVNGKSARILKVDGDLRGVVVPAGISRIRFNYAPASVYTGMALSIMSLLTTCTLLVLAYKSRSSASDARNRSGSAAEGDPAETLSPPFTRD